MVDACGHSNPATAKFCLECGAARGARCPRCRPELAPSMLKGVREPVILNRVVQPSGVRSRLAVAAGHLTRFVEREIELATLVERWERAQYGEDRIDAKALPEDL